jgi:hypothetical protein
MFPMGAEQYVPLSYVKQFLVSVILTDMYIYSHEVHTPKHF